MSVKQYGESESLVFKEVIFTRKNVAELRDFNKLSKLSLSPNDVLVRSVRSLISTGTELAFLTNTHTIATYPYRPGYSNAGKIVAVGEKVIRFKEGDRVVSRGPHASAFVFPASSENIEKIPDEVSYEQAVFCSLGRIALHGIKTAQISLGESVIIFGQGLVGQLLLQLAKLGGAKPLIAVDLYNNRLELSKKYTSAYVINPSKINLEKKVADITHNEGVNVIIDATGNPKLVPQILKIAKVNGRIIVVGGTHGEVTLDLYTDFQRKELTLIGCRGVTNGSHLLLKLLAENLINVEDFITHRFSFKKSPEAYKLLLKSPHEALGVIINWDY